MASLSIRSASSNGQEGNSPATNTVTKPSGTLDADFLVGVVASDETAGQWVGMGSTGFTEITALRSSESATQPKFQIVSKFASSEGASYPFDIPTFMSTLIWLFAIPGVPNGSQILSAGYGAGTVAASVAPDITFATHGITDPLLITAHAAVTESTARTFTTPAGMTIRGSAPVVGVWLYGQGFSIELSGNVGTTARTSTISAAEPWRTCSLAIGIPPPSGNSGLLLPF